MARALRSSESESTIPFQTLTLLYFVIFSVGLCKICWIFSRYLANRGDLQHVVNQMCDWAAVFPHDKFPQLLFFSLSLFALFVMWSVYFVLTPLLRYPEYNGRTPKSQQPSALTQPWIIAYLIFAFILNIGLVTAVNFLFLDLFLWGLSFLALPLFLYKQFFLKCVQHVESRLNFNAWHYGLITVGITVIFLSVFYPYIFRPLPIANEFMDISEQTILNDGKIVDNTAYINHHRLSGLQLYDPRQSSENLAMDGGDVHVKLPTHPALQMFLKSIDHSLYGYDETTQTLSLKGKMTQHDYQQLIDLYPYDQLSKQKINDLFVQSRHLERQNKQHVYSAEELEFKAKNNLEMDNKVKAGWLFFHHSWVLHPVLALSLGADVKQQTFLYGYGSAAFLHHILKSMDGVNFQDYFKVTFLFYPLYFLFFLVTLYALFKRMDYVCLGAILLSASFYLLGPQMIMVAPGYNPMRHLFELPMLYFVFTYFNRATWSSLFLAVLTGWAALIWSKDFGLFLCLAGFGTLILRSLILRPLTFSPILLAIAGIVGAAVLYTLPFQGVNYNVAYMLLGYMQPPITTIRISIILITLTLVYIFLIRFQKRNSAYFWLALMLFFYIQFQLLYYIWHPSFQHFLVLAPMLILGVCACIAMLNTHLIRVSGTQISILAVLFGLYFPSLFWFCQEKKQYSDVFVTHIAHPWSFKNGKFITTMAPQLFSESLNLIAYYAPSSHIYLISKYDALLPTLAQRMNALPVINLALDLLGQRDIERCIQVIHANKPRYLFVDTDINRDLRGEVLNAYAPWGPHSSAAESYGRYIALKNMRSVFNAVQNDYQVLEKGSLLTVYQRKADA